MGFYEYPIVRLLLGMWRQEDEWVSLAGHLRLPGELQANERPRVSKDVVILRMTLEGAIHPPHAHDV